jgi:hypothetical protein
MNVGVWCWRGGGPIARYEFSNGHTEKTVVPGDLHPSTLTAASDGTIWAGVVNSGLQRFSATFQPVHQVDSAHADTFTSREGLTANFVFSSLEDREGSIWVATVKGIDQFRKAPFHPIVLEQIIMPVILPHGGPGPDTLVATDCLINLSANPSACLPGSYHVFTRSLFEGHGDTVWIGTTDEQLWRYHNGKFTSQNKPFWSSTTS